MLTQGSFNTLPICLFVYWFDIWIVSMQEVFQSPCWFTVFLFFASSCHPLPREALSVYFCHRHQHQYRAVHIFQEGKSDADALSLLSHQHQYRYQVTHLFWEGNSDADCLASITTSLPHSITWPSSFPPTLNVLW